MVLTNNCPRQLLLCSISGYIGVARHSEHCIGFGPCKPRRYQTWQPVTARVWGVLLFTWKLFQHIIPPKTTNCDFDIYPNSTYNNLLVVLVFQLWTEPG